MVKRRVVGIDQRFIVDRLRGIVLDNRRCIAIVITRRVTNDATQSANNAVRGAAGANTITTVSAVVGVTLSSLRCVRVRIDGASPCVTTLARGCLCWAHDNIRHGCS